MKKITFFGPIIMAMILCTPLFAQQECANGSDCSNTSSGLLGRFNTKADLFMPQFDSKTDVDDIHTVAAVGTMLSDPRFTGVKFHAVAGAYGTQSGEYVPATELFNMVFGSHWSDAHNDYKAALEAVTGLVVETLNNGGDIWIAEAGQSDFSSDMVRQVKTLVPGVDTNSRIHIVQHSDWNEESAAPVNLGYVKHHTDYNRIADGNVLGNGTPGLTTDSDTHWDRVMANAKTGPFWAEARSIGNRYNGVDGRYLNKSIKAGGMDFSDTSESCWIFGFNDIHDVGGFFDEFSDNGQAHAYDVILRGGTIYDGSGEKSYTGDVAISGDMIAAIGDVGDSSATLEINVAGLAVAPGFVNMMSWANESLIEDGRSQSDIRQGVTLEIMGEGSSMGPLNDKMKSELLESQSDVRYDVEWTTLAGYLEFLEQRGISPNVASFIGAATPREYVIGHKDRDPTADELRQMRELVRQAMKEGALGVASSLIYPPGSFAKTSELIALSEIAAEYDGMYISHMRDEGANMLEAIEELLTISREANIRAEIYHLKSSGQANWHLFEKAVDMVEKARAEGLQITADVYTYPAGSTGLNAAIPPWVQEGGFEASVERMQDPVLREQIAREMLEHSTEWENMYLAGGTPDSILLVGFKSDALKPLTGKTLAEVAEMRGTDPRFTAMDLIVEDNSRVGTVYFTQSEDVVRRAVALPWVSFNSDAASLAPEGVFLERSPHPRAYGSFARVLGKYVRDEKLLSMEAAIHKLATLPSRNLKIDRRGELKTGFYADVVVFDPATIQDHATFVKPHQYSTGMQHVFVNGTQVLKDGEHTGAKPGRVVRGPGYVNRGHEASGTETQLR